MTSAGRLVVVGDSLLDVDTEGVVVRVSPDGPVPVVDDATDQPRPGGAALAAALAVADGTPVRLVTPLADDDTARRLLSLLPATVEVVPVPWSGGTTVKNRVRAGGQTITRIDRSGGPGRFGPWPAAALEDAAAVVVADYGLGMTSEPALRAALTPIAPRTPVVWDPHPRGADPVPGARLAVPNEREAMPGVRTPPLAAVGERAQVLRTRWSVGDVAVTVGHRGAVTTVGPGPALVVAAAPAGRGEDTCGAGDRFAVAAAVALAAGALPSEAVGAAVAAASAFVAAGGARVVLPGPGPGRRDRIRVATGGCFDLLHAGHVATLEAARALGDELVVCINSDASVRRLKGPDRPLQPAADRARVLRALACVDRVVVFDGDTPVAALRRLRPDIWVKGGDYAGAALPEHAVLAEWGGRAVTVPFVAGRSTTSLVARAARTSVGA